MREEAWIFPFYRLRGTHRAIGQQFGEACADLIRWHRDLALARLGTRQGLTAADVLAVAMTYWKYVIAHMPCLDEEIRGVAEGARLPLPEAYLLQLRAEVAVSNRALLRATY